MKVWVLLDADEVWDVFDSLEKADDEVMKHYYNHSEWLKMFEHEVH